MQQQRILLMSSSRRGTQGYLEHAERQLHTVLQREARHVLFIPYAAVSFNYPHYEDMVAPVFARLGYTLGSIHHHGTGLRQAVLHADAIAVGGGNTFALLARLYQHNLLDAIRERVLAGIPYIGWSAGSNVACPSIRTTNDMPVVAPPSLSALGLLPFQINPHFIRGKPPGYNGESREERLDEFLQINAPEQLLALPEGSALYSDGTDGSVLGEDGALHFQARGQVQHLEQGTRFPLSRIIGPAA
jgi:dipeptidase E